MKKLILCGRFVIGDYDGENVPIPVVVYEHEYSSVELEENKLKKLICAEFEISPSLLYGYRFLIEARYVDTCRFENCFVLLERRDGKIFVVEASRQRGEVESYAGQWAPEETTVKELTKKVEAGELGKDTFGYLILQLLDDLTQEHVERELKRELLSSR